MSASLCKGAWICQHTCRNLFQGVEGDSVEAFEEAAALSQQHIGEMAIEIYLCVSEKEEGNGDAQLIDEDNIVRLIHPVCEDSASSIQISQRCADNVAFSEDCSGQRISKDPYVECSYNLRDKRVSAC